MNPELQPEQINNTPTQLQHWIERLAGVAEHIESFVFYMFLLSLGAFSALAWYWVNPHGALWINGAIALILALPVLFCCLFWRIIVQLVDAPDEISDLMQDDSNVIGGTLQQFSELSIKEPKGLLSMFASVRQMRKAEGLDVLFETVSGITLLANPLFAILVLLSMMASFFAALMALMLWIIF